MNYSKEYERMECCNMYYNGKGHIMDDIYDISDSNILEDIKEIEIPRKAFDYLQQKNYIVKEDIRQVFDKSKYELLRVIIYEILNKHSEFVKMIYIFNELVEEVEELIFKKCKIKVKCYETDNYMGNKLTFIDIDGI